MEEQDSEEEKFDTQALLVGSSAETKFWELYKSERKFKDNADASQSDPRYAYFERCKQMHINPRASQVIKNDQSPVISHVNKFLNSATSVKAVCEAIKRYAYPVTQVVFVNNSLRPRDTKLIVESIERHMPTMELLNFTQNEFGPEGGKNIAANLGKMNNLKVLTLSHC